MKKILIVDDNDDNLYLLRALLEGHDCEVEQARNGSEALPKVLVNTPDMIISDILMPVIDGFTLCKILKADERLKQIPFIFYTATYTDPRDEKLALNMGADAFIVKPTEPGEFMRRIEEIVMLNKNGKLPSPQKQTSGEEVVLKEYNEVLIRKLEHKMLRLEQANKAHEAEIAARKQAEVDLKDSEERYRSLFENSMDGVLLTEPNGNVLKANPEACRIFGSSEKEICSLGRAGLVDASDPRLAEAFEERGRTGRFSGELTSLRKDGARFPSEISSVIFQDSKGKPLTCLIIRDITERKRAEEEILAALQEKDALLKEIHHRVKNNMQVISSLISLQLSAKVKVMAPDEITTISRDLQNRIKSISLVHEMLYQSKSLSRIDFKEYIDHLVTSVFIAFHIKGESIKTAVDITDKPVDITTAIPLGLIINELLTNALKYAFPSGRKGEIRITMTVDDVMTTLTVSDNGIGLPDNFNINTVSSFGMRLLSLLTKQLGGSLDVKKNEGTIITIQFGKGNDDKISLLDKI